MSMNEILRTIIRRRHIAKLRAEEAQMRSLVEQCERAIADSRVALEYALRRQREIEGELYWAEHGRVRHAGRGSTPALAIVSRRAG